jgi:ABC-type nitrate/sulfonate/bicarbonate transport system, permease component
MKNSSRFEFSLLGVVLLFASWFVVSKLVSSDLVFPGPEKVLSHSYRLLVEGKLLGPVGLTFLRAFFGMGLALFAGTVLGFLMGLSDRIYLCSSR